MLVQYRELVPFLKQKAEEIDSCVKYIEEKAEKLMNDDEKVKAEQKLKNIRIAFNRSWSKVGRSWQKFEKKYSAWLETTVDFTVSMDFNPSCAAVVSADAGGRPVLSFAESSQRTQMIKRKQVTDVSGNDPLLYLSAASYSAKKSKNNKLSDAIDIVMQDALKKKTESTLRRLECNNDPLPSSKALEVFMDSRVSRSTYQAIRKPLSEKNIQVLPSSYEILKQRKLCYPKGIKILYILLTIMSN
jgi:hypothetical protein